MRIWDISPGYLNRQSLLGEHRELHGIVSIIINKKKGYAKHPETIRWVGYGWALRMRHKQLAREMALRGYRDRSPVKTRSNKGQWPATYIDSPHRQFSLLKEKYKDREQGRIPLPQNAQQLWSHHKYSVLARNPELYKKTGQEVSRTAVTLSSLSRLLAETLRKEPTQGGIRNAVQHMWGYVSKYSGEKQTNISNWSLQRVLSETQKRAMANNCTYLIHSTALSELMVWLSDA
ncbi:Pyrimidine dimer DNA glycosylase /DNA-(apurinic or apyrimidinic site) lyase [Desulfocicer vacuolatum DSM 3385]|uniref:Pyrimidine dimer DNA glycosylase /DNA-(Apurinic or apyrimidinic site) lyase n=1 Tax=Desulfocicer vacuolatum DSM 3385 TaxID=1121400 RepID=A0A1W2ER69_9BACT|nr:DUF1722 domain-containing protein [Desulfocicer vacuolatum]SMD12032.1 Pyrimidine dimer DNA glycosylase /DNA-(apurinic or apyrimidinic site) lyase [Desulfocicer vacuolatum DSM 3385]